jgi:hypothetical protein
MPDVFFFMNADFWLWYVTPLLMGGIVASLYFMWGVRQHGTSIAKSPSGKGSAGAV